MSKALAASFVGNRVPSNTDKQYIVGMKRAEETHTQHVGALFFFFAKGTDTPSKEMEFLSICKDGMECELVCFLHRFIHRDESAPKGTFAVVSVLSKCTGVYLFSSYTITLKPYPQVHL